MQNEFWHARLFFFLLPRQAKQILLPEIFQATLGETEAAILMGT